TIGEPLDPSPSLRQADGMPVGGVVHAQVHAQVVASLADDDVPGIHSVPHGEVEHCSAAGIVRRRPKLFRRLAMVEIVADLASPRCDATAVTGSRPWAPRTVAFLRPIA